VPDTVTNGYDDAQDVLDRLEKLGISYDDVVKVVEDEGVEKFEKSWQEMLDTVRKALEGAKA
jgi:transaldolase